MDFSSTFQAITWAAAAIVFPLGVISYVRFVRFTRTHFETAENFTPNRRTFRAAKDAIAIDETRHKIAFFRMGILNPGPVRTMDVSDILRHGVEWDAEIDANGVLRTKNFRVSLVPSTPMEETVRFFFPSQLRAEQFSDILDQLRVAVGARDVRSSDDQKLLSRQERPSIAAKLTAFLIENGYPPAVSPEEVTKSHVGKAIALMFRNYESIAHRPLPKDTPRALMAEALEPIFGQTEQERPFGYKPSYLAFLVSEFSPIRRKRNSSLISKATT